MGIYSVGRDLVYHIWQIGKTEWFVGISRESLSHKIPTKHSVLPICHIWYTLSLPTLYIYLHYPYMLRSAFQRENSSHYPWEWKIVIPTILYKTHCGFPQLLPLHFQILKRLIAQTLTTPILSVKWGFGAARKHWKKPFVWWMQLGWIAWSKELEKTRLR